MLLAIAATEFEMDALTHTTSPSVGGLETLVSGVGPVEAAIRVTRFVEHHHTEISCIVNFGIAGLYSGTECGTVELLDICLARSESLGDYGVCCGDDVLPFPDSLLAAPCEFALDSYLLKTAERILSGRGFSCHLGPFVTVNAASGSEARGARLRDRYQALCENMEGGAIARVCLQYDLPMLELRSVSNLVEDRPGAPWKVEEACQSAGRAAGLVIKELLETA